MLQRIVSAIRSTSESNASVAAEFTNINLKRCFAACLCGLALSTVAIAALCFLPVANTLWLQRQIGINLFMVGFLLLAVVPVRIAYRRKHALFATLVPYIGFVGLSAFGILSAANDQLVTSSITTYVMACLICSVLFLIRPSHVLLLYSVSYAAMAAVNSFAPAPEAVRTSNLINAFTITAVSALLSVILWHSNRTNVLQEYQIRTQQKLLEKTNVDLHKMAYYDPLTDLPNRRYLNDILLKETALMARKNYESCLIMLDIDYFKYVNDSHGHPVGDKLLIEIGVLLQKNIRKYDTLCRLGGEEFIILLPQTSLEEAVTVADKLLGVIASEPFDISGKTVSITTSIGVARLIKDADATLIDQYTHVDKALYKAKRDGRNCVRTA